MSVRALVIMTVIWLAISGSVTVANALLGLGVAAVVLFVLRDHRQSINPFGKPVKLVRLLAVFVLELVKSAWRVAVIVSRPRLDVKPGIILYETALKTDFEISLLANLITLTPGTLTIDVVPNGAGGAGQTLVIHALDCGDPDQTRAEIRQGFERLIREVYE